MDHRKVDLNIYIKRGVGVCRHQALFAGTLLEKFVDDGILSGHVSVERNRIRRADDSDVYDGHSWVRYTNSAGKVYILDVAQQRLAPLGKLMGLRSVDGSVWDYARPEDRRGSLGRTGLRVVDPQTNEDGVVTNWFAKE